MHLTQEFMTGMRKISLKEREENYNKVKLKPFKIYIEY